MGARPAAFNTVRFSEKLMERHGIIVETLDLSEVFGRIGRLKDDDPQGDGQARQSSRLRATHGASRRRRC